MRHSLTLYALEPTVEEFDDAIRSDALDADEMHVHDLNPALDVDFDARLYSFAVEPTPPRWADLLAAGFPDFTPPPSAMAKVVVVIRLPGPPDRYFAATFGSGRFLLRADAYRPAFGLKVALNSIYEGDAVDAPVPSERLRVVQTTTVSKNTIRTLKQANRNAAFQDFEVDLQRDQLGRVVGAPNSAELWGARITGSDAVRVQVIEEFSSIGQLCRDLTALHDREDFKLRFSAIEDIRTVPEDQSAPLKERLLAILVEDPGRVNLSPAELLDWDEVTEFRFSLGETICEEIDFEEIQPALLEEGPSIELLQRERVDCIDSSGEVIARWSIFDALDVEIDLDERTFLLVGGRFYAVAEDYLDELHRDLAAIQPSGIVLPSSFVWDVEGRKKEESEGDYNERAATVTGCALMDKKTVRLDRGGDPIEVCDLFTADRQMIHVKRKFSSSSLSHLFGQGAVSGGLFLGNPEYRRKFVETLDDLAFGGLIPVDDARPDTAAFEVVYAIIGPWRGRGLADALPFFSKINLRSHARDLRNSGFKVTFCPIDLTPAPAGVAPPA